MDKKLNNNITICNNMNNPSNKTESLKHSIDNNRRWCKFISWLGAQTKINNKNL